ncbi:MAG: hypothetical protein M0R37_06970 [Bacteroidales bacterium]|nr:hypothetical protein [Bacteroidales bacterium]
MLVSLDWLDLFELDGLPNWIKIIIYILIVFLSSSTLLRLISPKAYSYFQAIMNRFLNYKTIKSLNHTHPVEKIVSNNIIFVGVKEDQFSEYAERFMREEKSQIIITNSREPGWFYKKFRNAIFDTKSGNSNAQSIIQNLETIFKQKNTNYESAYLEIRKLRKLFFEDKVINNVFPHLKKLSESGSSNKLRVNFFKYNINDCRAKEFENFRKDNTKLHLFFFETFINYNVKSIYCNICESKYEGEDALILSDKVLLYNNIKELHYRPSINSHDFFHYVKNHVTSIQKQETKLIAKQLIGDISECFLSNN